MKVLLDENLPRRLKQDFPEYDIFTVRDRGWNGITNGELLKLMIADGFDALITFDKNLQYQQNFEKYPVAVIVLTARSNQYRFLQPLVSSIKNRTKDLTVGVTVISEL